MAHSADAQVLSKNPDDLQLYPVKAANTIYKGAIVMAVEGDGYLVPGANTANGHVVGIAAEGSVLVAGESSGDRNVKVWRKGRFLLDASSIGQDDVGKAMYVVDDATMDETDPGNSVVAGVLVEYVSATSGWVDIGKSAAD